jgi:hypothetical protein
MKPLRTKRSGFSNLTNFNHFLIDTSATVPNDGQLADTSSSLFRQGFHR